MSAAGASTELLISLCRELEATSYLSGTGGGGYQDEQAFEEAGIQLRYNQFRHPAYQQSTTEFHPGLSAIDLLFNVGPRAAEVFREASEA